MLQKPEHWNAHIAESFQDQSVVEAYRHRPAYPPETFTILAGLIPGEPKRVLDVGTGTGNIARSLVDYVEQTDAVDFSHEMLEHGRRLPNGDNSRLRWLHGRIEDVALDPPYALITAGESLHWMDWQVVLPRFRELLVPGGYLALVGHDTQPDPWSMLGEIIARYRTDGAYQPYDMLAELERHALFHKLGEQKTAPVPFVQTIDDYIASYHSRAGFSRERMGEAQASAFDQEAQALLLETAPDGVIELQICGTVVWGIPGTGNVDA